MGFAYPEIDTAKCIDCGLCEKNCPGLKKTQTMDAPLLESYAAQCLDDSVRFVSSSGGLFTLIARYIFSQNGVVFGAAFDDTFHGVKHIAVETMHDLDRLQKSKYVQSDAGSAYQEVKAYLEKGRKVLFTGTPCQIAGLRGFLSQEYEALFLLDIVCHGVPAPGVWDEYVGILETKYQGKVTAVSFRDKSKGWRDFRLAVRFDNNREYSNCHSADLYMQGFLRNCYLRPSCYECNYKGLNRMSDITLGDLWGVKNISQEMDDNKGTSLIMISSEKGKSLLEKIGADIKCQPIHIDAAVKHNSAIVKSCDRSPKSSIFEKEFGTKPLLYLLKKYCSNSIYTKTVRRAKKYINKLMKK